MAMLFIWYIWFVSFVLFVCAFIVMQILGRSATE